MKYKVGDRVRIVDEWRPGCKENIEGQMDRWLGQVMTIRQVKDNHYKMVEDVMERNGVGWVWFESSIVGSIEEEESLNNFNMNLLDFMEEYCDV